MGRATSFAARCRAAALLALPALLACAPAASAGSLNLRWNVCWGDGGVVNRSFACNANVGVNVLVGSFILDADVPEATGNEIVVDIATAGATLSPWWEFKNPGACRQGSLALDLVIPIEVNCSDWADGEATGGIASYSTIVAPNSARIRAATSLPPAVVKDLLAGQEYFSFVLLINNQKTVGSPSCSGCSLGACINLSSVNVTTPSAQNPVHLVPGGGGQGYLDALATWQGGAGVITIGPTSCPAATPARERTWGAVKALYH